MANRPPAGCLYRRGDRWWYKLKGLCYPCKPSGGTLATKHRGAAVVAAEAIYGRVVGDTKPIAELIAAFEQAEAPASQQRHVIFKLGVIRTIIREQDIHTPQQLTAGAVDAYMTARRRQGRTNKTLANHRMALSRFCRFLVDQGELDTNPVTRTRPPKIERIEIVHLNRAELGLAFRIARERGLWAVFFAGYAALRLGEIRELRKGDIRKGRDGPILVVGRTKTNQPRAVPIPGKLQRIIERMGLDAVGDHEKLFRPRGRGWWKRYLGPIKAAVPKMARKGGGWYDLRRTVATRLVQAGVSIYTVAKLLGHKHISTTARYYAHLDAEAGRADLDNL